MDKDNSKNLKSKVVEENTEVDMKKDDDNYTKKELAKEMRFKGKYIKSVGRRKSAVAQVRLYHDNGKGVIVVNDKKLNNYFSADKVYIVNQPLKLTNRLRDFNFSILVNGGGVKAQAEAIRYAISKSLILFDSDLKSVIKVKGWLTRDSRVVESKKSGLKKARKRPQWRKR